MKAAIMGFGTVGSGVYEVLDRNRETVRKKAGEPIEIKYILNRRDLPGSPVEDLVVHEIGTILKRGLWWRPWEARLQPMNT